MTLKISNAMKKGILTDEMVAQYLQEQPDFFNRNAQLLAEIQLPHTAHGTISLVEAQVNRLRNQVTTLEEEITQLMSMARQNEHLFARFAKAHRGLFLAKKMADVEFVLDKLAHSLHLKVSLRLYDRGETRLSRQKVAAIQASHFCGQSTYLGRLSQNEGLCFVHHAPEHGSYALLPIHHGKDMGFLAFASQDGGHFHPHMNTLLVNQLASHCAILLTNMVG